MLSAVNKPTRNRIQESTGRKVFRVVNVIVLILLALICLLPFVNVIAISFSDSFYVDSNQVYFWPKGWTTSAYTYILTRASFWSSFRTSILRVLLGGSLNLFFIILTAYPLSKSNDKLHFRNVYTWYFFITMLVSGGMIPNYLLIAKLGLRDSIWSLVLPALSGSFGVFLMRQFMMTIPDSMLEAARVDGASEYLIFWKIVMPMVKPAWMTLAIFTFKDLWNTGETQYIYEESMKTLTAVMQSISSAGIARAGAGAAVALLMMIPPVVVFVISQSSVMETMATTGIKG